jgi:hypothetical protein
MPIGLPEIIILVPVLLALGVLFYRGKLFRGTLRNRARRFGYLSTRAYLAAPPRSDAEKQDAVDLALRGLVWCLLGLLFPPFVLVGLIPLFYGGRKLVYASMGLGLVDDADHYGA